MEFWKLLRWVPESRVTLDDPRQTPLPGTERGRNQDGGEQACRHRNGEGLASLRRGEEQAPRNSKATVPIRAPRTAQSRPESRDRPPRPTPNASPPAAPAAAKTTACIASEATRSLPREY